MAIAAVPRKASDDEPRQPRGYAPDGNAPHVDRETPAGTRIVITNPTRGHHDHGRTGTVQRVSRSYDHLAVEFDDEPGVLYRVHYNEASYLEPTS